MSLISISKENALVDEKINIKLSPLLPNEEIKLSLKTLDKFGNTWYSNALYLADEKGLLDIEKTAPIEGSYTGADSMGLFWSMTSSFESMYIPPEDKLDYTLEVVQNNQVLEKKRFTRYLFKDIEQTHVISEKLNALLCIPSKQVTSTLVICLTGSNGGLSPERARLLASHGIPSCALGYFRGEYLPESLEEISLDKVIQSIEEVKRLYPTNIDKIVLFGKSKGAELSLCLASYFPDVFDGVIASLPSSFVWCSPNDHTKSSWTLKGTPLPFIPPAFNMNDLNDLTKAHLIALNEHKNHLEASCIPVERILCPILLLSAEDDKVWPSAVFGDLVEKKIIDTQDFKHCKYKDAGHILTPPYYPTTSTKYWHNVLKQFMETGGTTEGHHQANLQSWTEIKQFISKLS